MSRRHGSRLRPSAPTQHGETVVTITSAEAGAFLLQNWPAKRRRQQSYGEAVRACVRALAGKVEPEIARQAPIEAIEDCQRPGFAQTGRRTCSTVPFFSPFKLLALIDALALRGEVGLTVCGFGSRSLCLGPRQPFRLQDVQRNDLPQAGRIACGERFDHGEMLAA